MQTDGAFCRRRGAAPAPEASHFTSFVDGQAETTPVTQQNAKTDFHVTDNHNECLRQSVEKERDIYEVSDDVFIPKFNYSV